MNSVEDQVKAVCRWFWMLSPILFSTLFVVLRLTGVVNFQYDLGIAFGVFLLLGLVSAVVWFLTFDR